MAFNFNRIFRRYKDNFSTMIHEVKSILNIWSSRGLALLGKITILKGTIRERPDSQVW